MTGITRYDSRMQARLAALAFVVVAACVPQLVYGPESPSAMSGYFERQVSPTRFEIGYSAPPATPIADVDRFALRRAAEVALLQHHAFFALRDRRLHRDIYVIPGSRVRAEYGGGYDDWRRYWWWTCIAGRLGTCDRDPLWPSRVQPRRRTAIVYLADLYDDRAGRWDRLDAAAVLATLGYPQPRTDPSAVTPD